MKVWFGGRTGVPSLEERASGLAAHLGPGIAPSIGFSDDRPSAFYAAARSHDVVWLMSQHPLRLLGAARGRRMGGARIVVDTGDLLYESERTAGSRGPRLWLTGWWEPRSVRLADAVVVRGTAHVPIAESWGARRVVYIPDGVEPGLFARRDAAHLRRRLGIQGRITVGVVSTIGLHAATGTPSPGWDVVETLARLRDLPLAGLVIGDGPGMPALRAMATRMGVADRLVLPGRVPLADLPDYLSALDIFVHTALNNRMSAVRTTGKLPLLLAAGCAAVVSRVGEAARVLEGTGMLLDFGGSLDDYAAALAVRVRELITASQLERWREIGPAIARREFDYALLGMRAAAVIRDLAA